MRQYTVTELSEKDIETIETALREKKLQASIDHLFWIPVPDDLLTPCRRNTPRHAARMSWPWKSCVAA